MEPEPDPESMNPDPKHEMLMSYFMKRIKT
jgi:hypothetical protein